MYANLKKKNILNSEVENDSIINNRYWVTFVYSLFLQINKIVRKG